MTQHCDRAPLGCGLEAYMQEQTIPEGQRRRLRLFQAVETGVCARIEQMCTETGVEVTDVAVLVVSPAAHPLFFGDDPAPLGTSVVIGHREKLHEFLHTVLPPAEDAPFDPYEDLCAPSPARCVRVLIVDDESLTVMSYGTFVTLRLDATEMAQA